MYKPDYRNLADAAANKQAKRTPLYDHKVSHKIISELIGTDIDHYFSGEERDLDKFFSLYNAFFRDYGYDTVTFEYCITRFLPHGGALAHPRPGYLNSRERFEAYPWDSVKQIYIENVTPYFDALRKHMPEGMKAVGGVGNGVFEIAQDLCGYEDLSVMGYDDPELYADIYKNIGKVLRDIWEWFLKNYADIYCVLRFGDDLGFKSNCLLSPEHIKTHILPHYRAITDLVHSYDKPFLLHCCGCIFSVMDDIIETAKIDSKHSNEDVIADFGVWVQKYGDKIGNFGGIDTDRICLGNNEDLKKYVTDIYEKFHKGHGGIAIGSGNSIPDYADKEKYLIMLNTVRTLRGDFR